jgi:hypothetical protein
MTQEGGNPDSPADFLSPSYRIENVKNEKIIVLKIAGFLLQ